MSKFQTVLFFKMMSQHHFEGEEQEPFLSKPSIITDYLH